MIDNTSQIGQMDVNDQLGLLKSILDSSTEYSIFAKDLNRTILTWNMGGKRLYGYSSAEIIGKSGDILHTSKDVESGKVNDIFVEVRKKGSWSGPLRRTRNNGAEFNAFVTITLRKDRDNNPIGYTVISRDITEFQGAFHILDVIKKSDELLRAQNLKLAKATREAQASNRLKSEFIANVSHELRTPLNSIIGFTELLYDDMVDVASPKYKDFLGNIIASANQLLKLIDQILDLAKIESNKMEFYPVKIDLDKLLKIMEISFQKRLTEKNIHLETQIDPMLGEILIDPEKLRQVINNYLANALKFSVPGGKVCIRVQAEQNNYFRIEVEDTGIGIKAEDLDKLFTKFHQINAGTTKEYEGTGLGLSLTKHIVEAQGGSVGVFSTYGKGSLFYATLPRYPQHTHTQSNQIEGTEERTVENRATILVVEHASIERSLIVNALTEEGYRVITAENAVTAIEQHHKQQFDAIILDLLQPDMGSWEIIRKLRSQLPSYKAPPLVVKLMVEQPVSIGFEIHDFLTKPATPQELLSALKWAGADEHQDKSILIIDHDQKALDFANQTLTEFGFRVTCASNKVSGLLALEKQQPDAVILDPFRLGVDGFELLRNYRKTERGLFTPLIIWTEATLSDSAREGFKNLIQRVLLKEESLKENIISELWQYLPSLNETQTQAKIES